MKPYLIHLFCIFKFLTETKIKIYILILFFAIASFDGAFAFNVSADSVSTGDTTSLQSFDAKGIPVTPISEFTYAGHRRWLIDGSQPYLTTKIKPISAVLLGTGVAALFVVQHQMQQNTIWKKTGPFHIQEDWQWTWALDKAGHFYGSYTASYIFSEILMAMGFSWDLGTITGSALGLLYTSYVEVLDGFSQDFGFSPTDFYADVAGASYHLLQHYVPVLQNFSPTFMYVNPAWIGEKSRVPHDSFIDDYSSQTFWMSINVHNLLPKKARKYWPAWLQLSVGYGVFSLCAPGHDCDLRYSVPFSKEAYGNRSLLIGFDYNLVELLPDGGSFWNWIKQGLRLVRILPAPTLQISDRGTNFYLLFPFGIKF